jgi:ProP effector
MSNASLKEQLQAVASQLTEKTSNSNQSRSKPATQPREKARDNKPQPKANPNVNPSRPNNLPKPKWLDYAQYGVELLRAYFPAGFKAQGEVKPLKKGIKQDLILRLSTMENIVTEDKACMIKSLSYYVNTLAYHKCVLEGTVRIDLDGNPDGVVTAEEAKYSLDRQQAKLLARQNAKSEVKKAETAKA